MVGGTKTILHREATYKQTWARMRDGDLCETFTDLVRAIGPQAVITTKVKGNATQEMEDEGNVVEEIMKREQHGS